MEWELWLADALVGAVAGGLGAFLTRKLPPIKRSTRSVLCVGLVLLGITVTNHQLAPYLGRARARGDITEVAKEMFGSERAAQLYASKLAPILDDPKFRMRVALMGKLDGGPVADPARNATARLVAAGMARLTDADQEAFADLKGALGSRSVELCAAFWTGRLRVEELTTGLHQLSEDQKAEWIRLSMEALTREIHETSLPVGPSPDTNADALKVLRSALTEQESAVFDRTTQAGENAAPKDACASFQMVLSRAKTLPPPVRATLIRMLVVAPDGG